MKEANSGEEAKYELETSEDQRTAKLTISVPEGNIIDTHMWIVLLEVYLQDLIKAYSKMPEDEKDLH